MLNSLCEILTLPHQFFYRRRAHKGGNKRATARLTKLVLDPDWEKFMTSIRFTPIAIAAAMIVAGPASAEKFKASLDGKSEVPATTSSGTGTADIDYDPASKKLSWKLTYSGLTGPATAAHFHGPAEAGKNAGVAIAIPNATSSPAEGSATLTDSQAADLEAGRYYVNVHTAANPGGEIRGQVTK
jgi:CHRD domain-containing protein